MSKKKKTRRDAAEIARSVVEQAIGEPLTPREENASENSPDKDTRNPAAVALSKLGASKGGRPKARAKKLTAAQRKEIAKKAAFARWRQNRPDS